jgi:hypothetical protein
MLEIEGALASLGLKSDKKKKLPYRYTGVILEKVMIKCQPNQTMIHMKEKIK